MQILYIAPHPLIYYDDNMYTERDILRIIAREELEKLKKEREKIISTLKLVRKHHNLPPDAKKIIDSLLAA